MSRILRSAWTASRVQVIFSLHAEAQWPRPRWLHQDGPECGRRSGSRHERDSPTLPFLPGAGPGRGLKLDVLLARMNCPANERASSSEPSGRDPDELELVSTYRFYIIPILPGNHLR